MLCAWWLYLLVFLGKLVEVSLSSLRSQLIVKGQKWAGSFTAAIEYLFWFTITATVLEKYASDPLMIAMLTLAYALGQMCGSFLEEKLALGVSMVHVFLVTKEEAVQSAKVLRDHGFALTQFGAEGINSQSRTVLLLAVKRRNIPLVRSLIKEVAPKAVITLTPSVSIEGGTLGAEK